MYKFFIQAILVLCTRCMRSLHNVYEFLHKAYWKLKIFSLFYVVSGFILVLSVEAHVSLSVRGGFPHSFLVVHHHLLGHRYCTDQVLSGLAMWISWCIKYLSLQLQRRLFCRPFSILMLISKSLLHVLHVHIKTFHQAAVEEIMEMFVDYVGVFYCCKIVDLILMLWYFSNNGKVYFMLVLIVIFTV